ncbi:MAG: N-acetyltransferase [Clostridium sp.]|nr:N-acetyltransferase [Clostridium sp.]
MIRNVKLKDAKEIVNIYNHYILNTNITFEIDALTSEEMANRIESKTKDNPWIVYEENNNILGYAYVGEFRGRIADRFTKEVSIYLKKDVVSKGIGTKLMNALIEKCKNEYDIHTLISVVTMPNNASTAIHKKFEFKRAGYFKEVGFKNDKWLDVEYLQLIL